jgi:apolipoprotein N-acyltransferase
VAVEIAIRRKLIYSRQDLLSPEFNQIKSSANKFFPHLNPQQTTKLLTSISRIIYLVTFIPLIFAVLSIAEANTWKVILWGSGALAWATITWLIEKKREARLVFLLVALFFSFHIIWFTSIRYTFKPGVIDVIIYILAVLLFFYLIGYLYFLLRRSKS